MSIPQCNKVLMQVVNRLVDEAAKEHGLRTGWYEAVFAESHVLTRAALVKQEVAGVRVGLGEFIVGTPRLGQRANVELPDAGKTLVEYERKRLVSVLSPARVVSDDKEILGAGEGHIEHAHHVKFCHPMELFAAGPQQRLDYFLNTLRLVVLFSGIT